MGGFCWSALHFETSSIFMWQLSRFKMAPYLRNRGVVYQPERKQRRRLGACRVSNGCRELRSCTWMRSWQKQ
ncbi:hypothetical protein BDL97_16G100200 [Sphagnum fallax]|nr:hypothetical protein BDL97_16G100200 [Sphagnum fallax]KAH8938739.1 hypothetical protein BDL97_16G100200 [Sphagnum fallax]